MRADRAGAQPARRRRRRRGVHRGAAHRDRAGAPPRRDPPRLRGRRHGDRMTRLFVVGDALLDRDLAAARERLAPDAPVPVVDAIEPTRPPGRRRPGRDARRRATGVEVTLVTALGRDAGGGGAARAARAASTWSTSACDGATPEKIRVLAGEPPARAPGPRRRRRAAAVRSASRRARRRRRDPRLRLRARRRRASRRSAPRLTRRRAGRLGPAPARAPSRCRARRSSPRT